MNNHLKHMKTWAAWLALTVLILGACQKTETQTSPYTAKDIVGTWVWTIIDGNPTSDIWVDTFTENGIDTCMFLEDNKWVTENSPFNVKDGILTIPGGEEEYLIVNVDPMSMVLEARSTKIRISAEKVRKTDNKFLVGTWSCDEYKLINGTVLKNYRITYSADGTYCMTYEGMEEPTMGTFRMYNNFMFYRSTNSGAMRIEVESGEGGPATTEICVAEDGTVIVNSCRRSMDGPEITLKDFEGVWMNTAHDGEQVPLPEAIFLDIDDQGHAIFSLAVEGIWTDMEIHLMVEKNNIELLPVSMTDKTITELLPERLEVMYFDGETFFLRNPTTGCTYTLQKFRFPEENLEKIRGMWEHAEDGGTILFKEDSLIVHIPGSEPIGAKYKLYGDILVIYLEDGYMIHPVEFGYDAERGECFMNQILRKEDGTMEKVLFYQPNYHARLAGGWLFGTIDGQFVPTYDLVIPFYDPKTHMVMTLSFSDGFKQTVQPFEITKGSIIYPEDQDFPSEHILYLKADSLSTLGCDGKTYGAWRICQDNPLGGKIIGSWYCAEFDIGTPLMLPSEGENSENPDGPDGPMGPHACTHTFYANGMVTYSDDQRTFYGTYTLFNNVLLMQLDTPDHGINSILWTIDPVNITSEQMTFFLINSDGTVTTNNLVKK